MDILAATSSPSSSMKADSADAAAKKKKKNPDALRTYRFDLKLKAFDPKAEQKYDEFNWLDLVAQEEETKAEKKRKELETQLQKARGSIVNSLDPYASDDDEQLKAIARKFESKYGGAADKIKKKKKERKLNDCADLGFGYDSNDSFIDNSEVHDEMVPSNITTAHGGFYINSGNLEFRARESADDDSDLEAVYQEGEKAEAAKKRRRKRLKNGATPEGDGGPSGAKKSKVGTNSDGSSPSDTTPTKGSRVRKEGGKPLGRPKKLNPDGTLVHPPKQPRQPKLDESGQPIVRKKLPGGQTIQVRRVKKVLPPGSCFAGSNTGNGSGKATETPLTVASLLGAGKQQNGDGTKSCPIDLTATPGATPPKSTAIMPAPKEIPSSRSGAPSSSVQLKTVETSPNSMITDQLVGDTQLRMLAATVSEAMKSVPPPAKMSHQLANSAKAAGGNKTSVGLNSETMKKSEATSIAAKKFPSTAKPSADTQAAMAKYMPAFANALANTSSTSPGAARSSPTSNELLLAAQKAIQKSLANSNKQQPNPSKQTVQQQLKMKKQQELQAAKRQQAQQPQQANGKAASASSASIARSKEQQAQMKQLYQDFYDNMQAALKRGDNKEYTRLVGELKEVVNQMANKSKAGSASSSPTASKAASDKTEIKPYDMSKSLAAAAKSLPSGVTIESVVMKGAADVDKASARSTPSTDVPTKKNLSVTVSTVLAKTVSSGSSLLLDESKKMNSSLAAHAAAASAQQHSSLAVLPIQSPTGQPTSSLLKPTSTSVSPHTPVAAAGLQQHSSVTSTSAAGSSDQIKNIGSLQAAYQSQQTQVRNQQLLSPQAAAAAAAAATGNNNQLQPSPSQQLLQQRKQQELQQQQLKQKEMQQQMLKEQELQKQKELQHQQQLLKQQELQKQQQLKQQELQKQQQLKQQQEILKQQQLKQQQELQKQQQLKQQQEQQQMLAQQQQELQRQQQLKQQQELQKQQQELQKQQQLKQQQELQKQQQELQKQQQLKQQQLKQQQEMQKQQQLKQQQELQKQQQLKQQQEMLKQQQQQQQQMAVARQQQQQLQQQQQQLQQMQSSPQHQNLMTSPSSSQDILSSPQQQNRHQIFMLQGSGTQQSPQQQSMTVSPQQTIVYSSSSNTMSSVPLPSMSSATPSLLGLTADNASQLLASMMPDPAYELVSQNSSSSNNSVSNSQQYLMGQLSTPPRGTATLVTGNSNNRSVYISSTGSSSNMVHTSPVVTTRPSPTALFSPSLLGSMSHGSTNSHISSTTPGYAKVASSPVMTQQQHSDLFSPALSKATSSPSGNSMTQQQQFSSGSNYQYFTSTTLGHQQPNQQQQQQQRVIIPTLIKSPSQQQQSLLLQQQQLQLQQQQQKPQQQQQNSHYYGMN